MEDEIAAAQEIYKAGKKNEKIKITGGIFEKKVVPLDVMLALGQLPTKEELYAKLVGSIKAPISGLHAALSGVLRGFVQVLKQVSEKAHEAR
jgi:large subunit ribosomal protein L10